MEMVADSDLVYKSVFKKNWRKYKIMTLDEYQVVGAVTFPSVNWLHFFDTNNLVQAMESKAFVRVGYWVTKVMT